MDAPLAFLHNIYSNLPKQSWIVCNNEILNVFYQPILLNTELVKAVQSAVPVGDTNMCQTLRQHLQYEVSVMHSSAAINSLDDLLKSYLIH
jgi:hypothetical protein